MGRVQNVLTFTNKTVTEKNRGTRYSDSKKENIQSGEEFWSSVWASQPAVFNFSASFPAISSCWYNVLAQI